MAALHFSKPFDSKTHREQPILGAESSFPSIRLPIRRAEDCVSTSARAVYTVGSSKGPSFQKRLKRGSSCSVTLGVPQSWLAGE